MRIESEDGFSFIVPRKLANLSEPIKSSLDMSSTYTHSTLSRTRQPVVDVVFDRWIRGGRVEDV